MSEMVERVAKALTKAFEAEWRVFDDGQAEDLARAAIEAMRVGDMSDRSFYDKALDALEAAKAAIILAEANKER